MSQAGRSTRRSAAAAVAAPEEEEADDEKSTVAATAVETTTPAADDETENAASTTAPVVSRKRKAEEELSTAMDDETNDNEKDENSNKKMKLVEAEPNAEVKEAEKEEEFEAKAAEEPTTTTASDDVAVKDETAKDDTDATTAVADAENSEAKKEEEDPSSVTTHAATTAMEEPEQKKMEQQKNAYDSLKYILVRNDGKPESMIKLVGLKSLFAKQLPKMPRAYIARLVFDPRHVSLAILSENPKVKDTDDEIIGAICYRAFDDMRFAEIAFCAVNATHQVKGYGTKLMTLLKKIGAEQGIEYFITYADNYAIGYFKKQGFSKSIQMPKGRYFGLIKQYDGGTPMECYVHPSCDFTRVPEMLEAQRNFILSRIEKVSNSKTIYPPIGQLNDDSNSFAAAAYNGASMSSSFAGASADAAGAGNGVTSVAALVAAAAAAANGGGGSASTAGSRGNQSAARAMAVPGMEQAGWTMSDLLAAMGQGKESDRQKTALKTEFLGMIRKIEEQHFAWPFREPVDTNEVPDYLEVIKEPIDLSTIDKRIRQDNHYKSKQMLYQDLMLMVNNCKLYNEPSSPYAQCASSLETYLGQLFRKEDIAGRG